MQTATAIYEGYLAYSPTPEEVSIAGPAGTALPPTSLPDTGGDPVGTLMPTALPPTGSSTPPPTATAMASPDPNIVPTSVAGMGPMTGTPTPFGSVGGQGEQFPSPTPTPASLPDLIPLNAGEIDDNADWDRYLEYRINFLRRYGNQVIDVDVTGRERIRVVDADGFPVLGAMVQVFVADQQQNQLVAEMRTYATGETLFFPNARQDTRQIDTFLVQVTKGGEQAEFTLRRREKLVHEVVLGQTRTQQDQDRLDVLFLLDSTSSMTDEIFQLQSNILHISSEIDDLPGDVDVRYGLVAYRDWGNFEYVTRAHDFTPVVAAFQTDLNRVEANSGDNNFDWPEALNESLHLALHDLSWRGEDTVKLVFLVSDARPHLDHPEETHIYTDEMVFAAQQGIKIHPIASSGLEPPGEYIFRQIAQYTMGRFIFLTYESSQPGAPGDLRRDLDVGDPDTQSQGAEGDYSVERLDELVLRLITDELAALHADNA